MTMAECIFQGIIQDVDANVEEGLNSMPVPSHLLLLSHPFGCSFESYLGSGAHLVKGD